MPDPIDEIMAEAIKAVDWSGAREADEPYYPKCAQAVREALARAGYTIQLDESALLRKGEREHGGTAR